MFYFGHTGPRTAANKATIVAMDKLGQKCHIFWHCNEGLTGETGRENAFDNTTCCYAREILCHELKLFSSQNVKMSW